MKMSTHQAKNSFKRFYDIFEKHLDFPISGLDFGSSVSTNGPVGVRKFQNGTRSWGEEAAFKLEQKWAYPVNVPERGVVEKWRMEAKEV